MRSRYLIIAASLVTLLSTQNMASAQTPGLVPFDQFFQQLSSASLESATVAPQAQVASSDRFEEMRSHLIRMYSGVHVKHSFMLDSHPFDCVPVAEQPSVRLQKLHGIAAPPPQGPSFPTPAQPVAAIPSQVDPASKTDGFGNALGCEASTIPMRRITLDDVGRFKSLQEFFHKSPSSPANPAASSGHKYAYSYQYVANLGGTTDIALYSPPVNTALSEVFSLSQFWYINDNGPTQTLEGGIQVYPQLYGTNISSLFIYYTADNYGSTGCYNLDCPAFVQTNPNVYLGKGFDHYSHLGAGQYLITLKALLYQGNWWVYYGGSAPENIVGYYPGALYQGTAMARGADLIEYGGEVVGTTVWPPMGSGQFAGAGVDQASFQKNIGYQASASQTVPATLIPDQPSISCFTNITKNSTGIPRWNTFFFFGGPGGRSC